MIWLNPVTLRSDLVNACTTEVNAQDFVLRLLIFIGLDGITISELMRE